MKHFKHSRLTILIGSFALVFSCLVSAQVGINTKTPTVGTALDVVSTDKGFIMTKVALTGTNDTTTITPSAVTGLMVYNTANGGAAGFEVIPGFYYWNGSSWRRFYNQGYTLSYTQSAEVTASTSNTTYVILPGLDTGNITVPFTGTYQIRVEGYYSAGNLSGTAGDGASQGSISLAMATGAGSLNMIKETYLTTASKRLNLSPTAVTVNNLAQSATIVWNIYLTAGVSYRFAVRGREWLANYVGTGIFGKNTSGYSGAGINNAQRGTMAITLIKQ